MGINYNYYNTGLFICLFVKMGFDIGWFYQLCASEG